MNNSPINNSENQTIHLQNKDFTLKELESCVTGNLFGRTFNRLVLAARKGIWVNTKKISDVVERLDITTLNKINSATTSDKFKGIIRGAEVKILAQVQTNKKTIIDKLKPESKSNPEKISKLLNNILVSHEELIIEEEASRYANFLEDWLANFHDEGPSLARYNDGSKQEDELIWVYKNSDNEWERVREDHESTEIVDTKNLKFIDLDSVKIVSKERKVKIFLDGKEYSPPLTPSLDEKFVTLTLKSCEEFKEDLSMLMSTAPLAFEVEGSETKALDQSLKSANDSTHFVTDKEKDYSFSASHEHLDGEVILQAKGYLSKDEFCADWAGLDQVGNVTLAIVADAAGNKEKSHDGSLELCNLLRKTLMTELMKHEQSGKISTESLQTILTESIMKSAILTASKPESKLAPSTLACTLILSSGNDRYAVGFCVGDARIMLKQANGEGKDLTPTDFSSPYSDSGSSFGGKFNSIQPIFQKLSPGDTLLLGSDGFGDNMEAKTLGKTPLEALGELYQAGKLDSNPELIELFETPPPWLIEADSVRYWTEESKPSRDSRAEKVQTWHRTTLENKDKKALQALHTLYSEHVLTEFPKENLIKALQKHCTESDLVKASLFILETMELFSNIKLGGVYRDKKEYDEDLNSQKAGIVEAHMKGFKEYACKLTNKSEEELKDLFDIWDKNPLEAFDWLEYRIGKPDDFSLIALTIT